MNNVVNELLSRIANLEREVERLDNENKILRENAQHNDKVVDKVNWENKRLNNIINEIRKWLEEDYKRTINNEVCDYPRYYLDKFDEIVGSDKE